jgi:single-strand DNA-binding protein
MMNVNKVIVAGVLLEDPPLRKTGGGTSVTTALLEVKREWDTKEGAHKEEVSQVEVDVFGRAAENLNKYLKKGDPVLFEGHLKLETWESEGQKCARLIVVAESLQFISDSAGGAGSRRTQSQGPRPQKAD